MDKRETTIFLATTAIVSFICGIFHQLEIEKLNSANSARLDKYLREHGRNMYVSGFDDCNSRNHYTIPRDQYPKFD